MDPFRYLLNTQAVKYNQNIYPEENKCSMRVGNAYKSPGFDPKSIGGGNEFSQFFFFKNFWSNKAWWVFSRFSALLELQLCLKNIVFAVFFQSFHFFRMFQRNKKKVWLEHKVRFSGFRQQKLNRQASETSQQRPSLSNFEMPTLSAQPFL